MSLFKLSHEHEVFRESVASFVDKELRPHVLDWEKKGFVPREVWQRLGELNYFGIYHKEECGGLGADYLYNFLWGQEIAKCGSSGVALGFSVQSDMATPALAEHGSTLIKEKFLIPALKGNLIASIAVSEPECGSDVASMKTFAKRNGDFYVLNGQKMFITNGIQSDFLTLLCKTSLDQGHKGFSLFVVPMNLEGVSRSKALEKICYPSSDTAQIFFKDVKVPKEYLIGEEGLGFIYQMKQFQYERLIGVALSIGSMQRAYELTKKYASERKSFNQKISSHQVIKHQLAQIASEIMILETTAYHCASLVGTKDITKEISMLKLICAQSQSKILDHCTQIHGGYGLMLEYEISRYFRDAKLMSIGGGTNEIMKEIISKMEGL